MITLYEEAMDYFNDERLFADKWLQATPQVQHQSLRMAENQINLLKLNNFKDEHREIRIKKAIFEQALYLFENSQRQKLINQGVSSFSVEGLSETYDLSKARKLSFEAMEFIKPYLLGSVGIC